MAAKIKNFAEFIGHIRASQTIDDISMNLEIFIDYYAKDYEEEFLDNYIGEAKKLLDEFSRQIIKLADEEIITTVINTKQGQEEHNANNRLE